MRAVAAAVVLAGLLTGPATPDATPAPDPVPATLPAVQAATETDAYGACWNAYGPYADTPAISVYVDCVNAAAAHFHGRGHHTHYWNT